MVFGDLFKNSTRNTQVLRFPEGRDAFRNWIKDAVATNKPYSQMATELISSAGTNSEASRSAKPSLWRTKPGSTACWGPTRPPSRRLTATPS